METRIHIAPSSFETVDFAMFDYINDKMNLSCDTHNGFEKVPVIWAGTERSVQVKKSADGKDLTNSLIYPIISIERVSVNKSNESKGKYFANLPSFNDGKGGVITRGKIINQEKTSNFANADMGKRREGVINFPMETRNKKIVYQTITIPQIVYSEMKYKIEIVSNYQQHMNTLMVPFLARSGTVHRIMLERDGHKYEAFIEQPFEQKNNTEDMSEEARTFQTVINVKVFGYTSSAMENDELPYVTKRENPVEFKMPRERVVLGDEPDFPGFGRYKP